MTTPLSPAAQAVLDAYAAAPADHDGRAECAAALRAVAGQVVSPEDRPSRGMRPGGTGLLNDDETRIDERQCIRRQILAIAAELEDKN